MLHGQPCTSWSKNLISHWFQQEDTKVICLGLANVNNNKIEKLMDYHNKPVPIGYLWHNTKASKISYTYKFILSFNYDLSS